MVCCFVVSGVCMFLVVWCNAELSFLVFRLILVFGFILVILLLCVLVPCYLVLFVLLWCVCLFVVLAGFV